MRLLHTSDWHLGRSLHRADLRDAQAGFLDALVETCRSERVDAVLVSGDVYDRAVPSLDAVQLCEEGLVRLRETGARVVVISGNHDSARRLGFGSQLVDAAGVHLRTDVAGCAEPIVLSDEHGDVAVYAVPYLEPDAVRDRLPAVRSDVKGVPTPPGQAEVLTRAMAAVHQDRTRRRAARSVVLAHAWVGHGLGCDSERDIGGVGGVPAAIFDGVSYTALGHLHGPQVLAEGLRYSGSPLAYSFSEAGHRKGSWLVELGPTGVAAVEQVPAPSTRPLASLTGTLDDLLTSPAHDALGGCYLQVTLTDRARPDDAMARLSGRFPHVLVLAWQPTDGSQDPRSYRARVTGRSDLQVAASFVEHVRRTPPTDAEQELFEQALAAGRTDAA